MALPSICTFDWTESDSVWRAVVEAVARTADTTPFALPPVSTVIDPDALDTLLRRPDDDGCRTRQLTLCFVFAGYWVLLSSSGRGYLYDSA
ncbi:HalOD1 output domain-containing protein [Salinigranum sp.]|uniref:HalOD1 output domain-containing protein n=1 Tax=Salinigranum sp. TaxID=1966351 RepID=UPI0035693ACC